MGVKNVQMNLSAMGTRHDQHSQRHTLISEWMTLPMRPFDLHIIIVQDMDSPVCIHSPR